MREPMRISFDTRLTRYTLTCHVKPTCHTSMRQIVLFTICREPLSRIAKRERANEMREYKLLRDLEQADRTINVLQDRLERANRAISLDHHIFSENETP